MSIFSRNYSAIWNTIYSARKKLSLLEAPRAVDWVATHRCNFICSFCEADAGEPLQNELSTAEITALIEEMASMGVEFLSVTGGEPLLRNDLFHVLHFAKEKGMKVGFITNCSLVPRYETEIKDLKPDAISVSIDGLKDTHKILRGDNADLDTALRALQFFREINIPMISVVTTVNKINYPELEAIGKIISTSGAKQWRINLTIPQGRAKGKDSLQLDKSQVTGLFNFIRENRRKFPTEISCEAGYLGEWETKLRQKQFFCGCGWNRCTIMADGKVMGCTLFEDSEKHAEANIRDMTFREIWDKKFEQFRKPKLPAACNKCRHTSACRGGCWIMRQCGVHCLKDILQSKSEK